MNSRSIASLLRSTLNLGDVSSWPTLASSKPPIPSGVFSCRQRDVQPMALRRRFRVTARLGLEFSVTVSEVERVFARLRFESVPLARVLQAADNCLC